VAVKAFVEHNGASNVDHRKNRVVTNPEEVIEYNREFYMTYYLSGIDMTGFPVPPGQLDFMKENATNKYRRRKWYIRPPL
jgi:hypothetical protein